MNLVPDFARDEEGSQEWTPLTDANPDYERLWTTGPVEFSPPPPPAEPASDLEPPPSPEPRADTVTPGFTGTLVTGDEVLNASVVVGPERIVLWGGGEQIGSWTHEQCQMARLTFSRFAIKAEGDTLTFTADNPSALDQALAEAVPQATPTSDSEEVDPVETAEVRPEPAEPALEPEPVVNVEPPDEVQTDPAQVEPEDELPVAPLPEVNPPFSPRKPRIKAFRTTSGDESNTPPTPAEEAIAVAASEIDETAPDTSGDFGGETIADSARTRSQATKVKARRFLPTAIDLQRLAIKSGAMTILVGVLVGLAFLVFLLTRGGGDESPTSSPVTTAVPQQIIITTAPPVTVATTAPLPETTLFATDPTALRERWNRLAEIAAPNMVLIEELVSPFILLLSPNVSMEGVLDPFAGNVTMRATPTGTPEGDGAILSALGILIGTADPTLDGGDRKALLAQLGLDVDRPELAGIDGTLTYNGLAYRLVYLQEQNSLDLSISPEGAAPPTTAN